VPCTPIESAWTSQDLQRFVELVDRLKEQFAIVIIDLPPILGLAETIRLSRATDSIALIIRWGRTERQFVQFALDALHSAGVFANAAILNDIDLRAQRRRGYRDRSVVYTDKRLYQTAAVDRKPDSVTVSALR
jgi:tyrosine-protein kinase Etk/Wzc